MNKLRGFEVVTSYLSKNINLPERKTAGSAAYDLDAAEDVDIPVFSFGQKPIKMHGERHAEGKKI